MTTMKTQLFVALALVALLFVFLTPTTNAVSVDDKFIKENGEQFTFQTEVNKLMNIIINSLYSKKEIFLRELISNASDALDKIRFLALTNSSLLGEGDLAQLDIRISIDKENRVLTIRDKGVGMTKEELIKNLGTIAQSGTKEFIQKLSDANDAKSSSNLIGQFGVGFYSLFLVADSVVVRSKSNDDDQYIWTSDSQSSFTITKDPNGNTIGRGTQIDLHIKEDSLEYLDQTKVRDLIKTYSQFINFPIYLLTSREIEVPKEVEETAETEKPTEEPTEKTTEDVDIKEEGEEEESTKPEEPTTEKKTVTEWEEINDSQPIWMKQPKDLEVQEYYEFFKTLTGATEEPLCYAHFAAQGDVEFKSLLYIPPEPPANMFDLDAMTSHLKLYVRRVFITDNLKDLVPNWLRFLQGIIDCEDLPLNVSREMLQKNKILELIKKKIIRKFISMVEDIATPKSNDEIADEQEEQEEEQEEKVPDHPTIEYMNFFKKFGTNLKIGLIEDSSSKKRLTKLVMFPSNKAEYTTFDQYIKRMKEGQDQIYFIAGKSKDSVETSPLIEQAIKRGYEVLYMVDPIDEYVVPQLTKYEKYPLTNLAREGVKFPDEKEEDVESTKQVTQEFKPLTDYLGKVLADKVEKVVISKVLADSPSVLVANSWGITANMERIMKAQSQQMEMPYVPKKVMEINPNHPLVKQLLSRLNEFGADDEIVKVSAHVIYETSALTAGYSIDNPTNFANWIYKMMTVSGEKLAEAKYESQKQESKSPFPEGFNMNQDQDVDVEPESTPEYVPPQHDEL
ncbi:hypothetical protein CYY_006902 [Polysphondylium violaceum]|uniref:Histidine kinase/HSP90-like ATPase domain-containing protein n=1 Tax=Polysphondylium violaceum TaxID=133409 RepID=A0A8J4PRS5_9MYCE|nr:hypothetical protein CYY_006902 [Polysphondylium violaceum]